MAEETTLETINTKLNTIEDKEDTIIEILNRHTLRLDYIKILLENQSINYEEEDKNEATKNACKIEHVITDRAFSQIVNFMKNNKVEIKCEY